jgi:glutamate/tyrosine decarboxylase-like PLP-dependent enzyme
MVLPITAHASFHKAAHYLGIKPVVTAIDPQTFRADVEAMRKAITPNTILLVGSAPNYSQGVVDPIAEIGQLALEHDIPLHVDGCVGGIHLAYMRKMGYPVPAYDFTVPGVTSISADLHKYGYAAKGASVILYKNKDLRRYQIFACTDTTAYTLINPTVLSTKSGGPLAGAWAILHYLGDEGYKHIVETVQRATEQLIEGVNAIPGLRVLGEPNMCMFSFASENVNAFQLADEMNKRGWYIQGQFATQQSPRSLHVSVMYGNAPNADAMLVDLRECVEKLEEETPIDSAAVQQLIAFAMQSPSPEQAILELADSAGIAGTELPDELAYINEILEALPDEIANKLLIDFFNDLYV